MIQAQISIRVRGQIYRYTRDVTTDTYGEGERFYGYRGNARRKLVLSENISSSTDTGLERNKVYSFSVDVNGEGSEEYTLSFPTEPGRHTFGSENKITFFELMQMINNKSNAFELIYEDYDRSEEGFYFVAGGRQSGTTIDVTDGSSANPLFSNLNYFTEIGDEIASDNFFDQTSEAGQIKHDLDSLSDSITTDDFVNFPESEGATNELVRDNRESKGAIVVNKIVSSIVDNLNVVEIVKNVRHHSH